MLKIEITKSGIAAIGRNGFRDIGRAAIGAAASHWRETFLPLHFQNIAFRRYGYKPRSKAYQESKVKRRKAADGTRALGETAPLVFTGRSRERALSGEKINVTAPNHETFRAEVVIDAPAFNLRSDGQRMDMRDEVTRINKQEEKTLQKKFAEEWERQLINRGLRSPKKTRRIG